MIPPSLDPVHQKMRRVNEHAQELNGEIQSFYATTPYEIVHEFDSHPADAPPGVVGGVHLYRVNMIGEIPTRVSIIAGEILRDLRSALDYVAWQLTLAHSDSPPPTTAFPIFVDKGLYIRDAGRFIGGVDASIHPEFDAVQPYHAGGRAEQPLWILHRLANDDKHKAPHVISSLPAGITVERPPGVDLFLGGVTGPFEPCDVVGTVGIIAGTDPETQLKVGGTFALAFGKETPAQGRHLTEELDRMGREVQAVINRFTPFFPA